MTALDELERRVLADARRAVESNPGSKELGWALMVERLGSGSLPMDHGSAVASGTAGRGLGTRLAEVLGGRAGAALVAASIAGAVGYGAGYWARGQSAPSTSRLVMNAAEREPESPKLIAQKGGQLAREPATEEGPKPSREQLVPTTEQTSAARDVRSSRAAADTSGQARPQPLLGEEARLLRSVDAALRSGKPVVALGLLGELDRRFPSGQLREERAAARVAADCQRVDGEAAQRAGTAFLDAHRGNAYAERVRRACGIQSTGRR